ncbi:MAG: FtsH protease activity modulator HflK [bacterium]|nr:FtsH protease activity modulator HflK [bacterium]
MTNDNIINLRPGQGPEKIINFLKKLSFIPILVFLIIVTVPTMMLTVDSEQEAVILRFGKYDRTVGPGLHFKLPWGIEDDYKVDVRKVHKMEFGFRTAKAGIRTEYDERKFKNESIMLTGDLNVADVEWSIQFRIKDAKDYLFNVRNVKKNMSDISQAVMRQVVGDHTVNEAINVARDEVAFKALEEMQKVIDEYKMGVHLDVLKLQAVLPPEKVRPSFDAVNAAEQDAKKIANVAEQQRRKLVQEEKGKAEQVVKQAEAYKVNLVNRAKGDTKRFLSLYEEYRKAPTITKKRLYFDKMKDAISNSDRVFIVDPDVKGIVPFLSLGSANGSN